MFGPIQWHREGSRQAPQDAIEAQRGFWLQSLDRLAEYLNRLQGEAKRHGSRN